MICYSVLRLYLFFCSTAEDVRGLNPERGSSKKEIRIMLHQLYSLTPNSQELTTGFTENKFNDVKLEKLEYFEKHRLLKAYFNSQPSPSDRELSHLAKLLKMSRKYVAIVHHFGIKFAERRRRNKRLTENYY